MGWRGLYPAFRLAEQARGAYFSVERTSELPADGAVVQSGPSRPELAAFLEVKRRMSRVRLQQSKRLVGGLSCRGRKKVIAFPEIRSGIVIQSFVDRPASYLATASRSAWTPGLVDGLPTILSRGSRGSVIGDRDQIGDDQIGDRHRSPKSIAPNRLRQNRSGKSSPPWDCHSSASRGGCPHRN